MKSLKFILIAIILCLSCSRYEEGPEFSLRSRTARLCKTWKVERVVDSRDNSDKTSNYADRTETFEKNGTYIINIAGNKNSGTWEFKGKDEIVILEGPNLDKPEPKKSKLSPLRQLKFL